jgi:hypothetical protein
MRATTEKECPQKYIDKTWKAEERRPFLKKLQKIEKEAREGKREDIKHTIERGTAPHRIENRQGKNDEFHDNGRGICWTGDYEEYVRKYKVKPDSEFIEYVNNYNKQSSPIDLRKLKQKLSRLARFFARISRALEEA